MNVSDFTKNLMRQINENSPAILAAVAVASTISAAGAGIRAGVMLERRRALYPDRTRKEAFHADWKFYIPPVAACGIGVLSVAGMQSIQTRRAAALMTAYSLSETAFKDYQAKVVEQIGEKKEQLVRDEVNAEHIRQNPVTNNQVLVTGGGKTLCYDSVSGRYFQSDMETIRRAINDINQKCLTHDYASQNDLYFELGLPTIPIGEDLGWRSDHLLEVSFSSHINENGEPCLAMDYRVGPKRGYYREH